MQIPEKFLEKMKVLLGKEYEPFVKALDEPPVRGIRVNNIKISTSDFLRTSDKPLSKISYTDCGFICDGWDGIGTSAEHHSGMIYVQDPGAMATVNALDVKPGWWVLDSCAAPGGKSGQLADKIGDSGFLLANEYVPKRAKIIVGNLERLGVRNAMVTSLDTAVLGKMFGSVFDLVLCDVPCSGEGMFRKSEEAVVDWSEDNVLACAKRQRQILENISAAVKPGGYLLYSTCTYSREENECVIDSFLCDHPDYFIVEVKAALRDATSDGVLPDGSQNNALALCRRFYPHKSRGEGQFIALLQKRKNNSAKSTILYKDATKPLTKEEAAAVNKFFSDNMKTAPSGRLVRRGEGISLIPHSCPIPPKGCFMPGIMLGEVKRGIFFPHHQFFSAYGTDMIRQEHLTSPDPRTALYLRGEEIEARSFADSGWCAVLYEGVALGGGKASGGKIKNHYPKGLRNS